MKPYNRIGFGVILFIATLTTSIGQVRIDVPVTNILNGTELTVVKNILYTDTDKWEPGGTSPSIWSISGAYFTHTSLPGVSLPASILQWQLESIGGVPAPFRSQDVLPGFQWFSTSPKNWYEPHSAAGHFIPGNVAFEFKISAEAFLSHSFVPGEYSLTVAQNYGSTSPIGSMSPDNVQIIIVIPTTITLEWISNNTSRYHEVTSLNSYRSPGNYQFSLGTTEITNSVDFTFWARAISSSIQFTSSSGATGSRSPSLIKLGSTNPKIITSSVSTIWKNYTPINPFTAVAGNRNTFELLFSISKDDFQEYFFEAGTYTLQMLYDARSTDHTSSASQNMDVTMEVHPLSEIIIPGSGQTVNFEFNSPQQYSQGQSKVVPGQIKLSNNEDFELYVKSGTNFFTKSGVQSDVASNILQIGIDGASANVPLNVVPQKIISNGNPVLDEELNIKYTIPAHQAQGLISKEKTTYSIDVIYSFTAL
ncbi:MAG TPA: hypothetical protein VKZ54_00760 [Membranihabitans sp.]|nr:hypothetical protein [Membranihabitans sp.]